MSGLLYFGTQERMAWVKAPAIDVDLSKNSWLSEGVYLNGGAYVNSSVTGHKRYQFSWNLAAQEDVYAVLDYADGLYGSDLIYFLDPFAVPTNLLPSWWAAPRLQAEDAPPLTLDVIPSLVGTAANTNNYPTKSAVFTLGTSTTFDSLWLPIPAGYKFHLGVHGSATGTAAITYTPDGESVIEVVPLPVTSGTLTNVALSGATGVTLSATGEGFLTVAGMVAQVLPDALSAPTGRFSSGRGHSGCAFAGSPTVTGYSAPSALDKVAASAILVEVGAWLD